MLLPWTASPAVPACSTRYSSFVVIPLDSRVILASVIRRGTALFLRQALHYPPQEEILNHLRQGLHDSPQEEILDLVRQALNEPSQEGTDLMSTLRSHRLYE